MFDILKITLTSLILMAGLFGETYNKDKKRLTLLGGLTLLLAVCLGIVEFQSNQDQNEKVEAQKIQVKKRDRQILVLQEKLDNAEIKAAQYHDELALFALSELLPSDIRVTTSETTVTNLGMFSIVIQNGKSWNLVIDTKQVRLCPNWHSSLEQGNDEGQFQTKDQCLPYELRVGGAVFIPSDGKNRFPYGGNCINCPAGGNADWDQVYDIRKSRGVYKLNFSDWPNEDPIVNNVDDTVLEADYIFQPGFAEFVSFSDWNLPPSQLQFTIHKDFPYNNLLNRTDELQVYLVPKPDTLRHFVELMKRSEKAKTDGYPECVLDDGVSADCNYYFDEDMFSLLENPYQFTVIGNEILALYTSLLMDDFSLTVSIKGNETTLKVSDTFPPLNMRWSYFYKYIKLGSVENP